MHPDEHVKDVGIEWKMGTGEYYNEWNRTDCRANIEDEKKK